MPVNTNVIYIIYVIKKFKSCCLSGEILMLTFLWAPVCLNSLISEIR